MAVYIYKNITEFNKHMERLIARVDMSGQESWILGTDHEMFKGWDRANSDKYVIGNTFKRNQIKYLVIANSDRLYDEPTENLDVFRPLQKYRTFDASEYIPCNHFHGEYLLKGAQRFDPIDGQLYWMKLDVMEQSLLPPSEARAADPKTWGIIEIVDSEDTEVLQ